MSKKLKDLLEKKESLLLKKKDGLLLPKEQEQLDDIIGQIVDLEEAAEAAKIKDAEAAKTPEAEADGYVVPEDEEDLVHAKLTNGTRFDSETGKEISSPYMQKFSVKEFGVFSKHAESLGIKYEVIHNPK